MTDYWKSNERKYCDFCKCWISDNKASVAFHESGKRHKLNVAKRITDISRSSEKAERERQKMDAEIRKMEDAALRSYAHDIHCQGDMTARSISAIKDSVASGSSRSAPPPLSSRLARQVDPMRMPGNSDDEDECKRVSIQKVSPTEVPNASLWVEGKSDDGFTYYWNVKTNESVWRVPKEGFLSYAEYERINGLAVKQQEMQQAVEAKTFRENVNEEVAKFNRERMKQFRRQETPEEKESRVLEKEKMSKFKTEEEAATQEIGGWQVVHQKPPPEPIDWELPVKLQQYVAPVVSEVAPEPPSKRFKEKTIAALNGEVTYGTSTTFKKRKFAAKGNERQRLNDD